MSTSIEVRADKSDPDPKALGPPAEPEDSVEFTGERSAPFIEAKVGLCRLLNEMTVRARGRGDESGERGGDCVRGLVDDEVEDDTRGTGLLKAADGVLRCKDGRLAVESGCRGETETELDREWRLGLELLCDKELDEGDGEDRGVAMPDNFARTRMAVEDELECRPEAAPIIALLL